nr:rod shape-determining protein [bacterium]
MATNFLAIKLGSSVTTIYKQGEGFILSEPSLVAVNLKYNEKQIVAVGSEAKKFIGKSSDSGISVVSPISEGIINDSALASEMLKHFLLKVCPKHIFKPTIRALICVPLGISLAEKLTFERTCYAAGVSDCVLIPSVVCAAIGAGVNIESSEAHMVVGIGAGCTDIAIFSENMLINGVNIGLGGSNIDKAIIQQIYNNCSLIISDEMAEKIKKDIGSLYYNDLNSVEVSGKDAETGKAREEVITAVDIYPAIE